MFDALPQAASTVWRWYCENCVLGKREGGCKRLWEGKMYYRNAAYAVEVDGEVMAAI
jgi:hypothetical protein